MLSYSNTPSPAMGKPQPSEQPPKKSFLRKLWDNGGKHLAIAAGSAAGAYALGKGAQYLDRKMGGGGSRAIGRAIGKARQSVARDSPRYEGPPDMEDLAVAEATVPPRPRRWFDRNPTMPTYGQLKHGETLDHVFTNPYAEHADLVDPGQGPRYGKAILPKPVPVRGAGRVHQIPRGYTPIGRPRFLEENGF